MSVVLHHDDLGADVRFAGSVAVDTEAMGLQPRRDRLCVVQLSAGDGNAHLVKFRSHGTAIYDAPRLKALFGDSAVTKIFHFARFDVAMIRQYLGVTCRPIYCTKIASRLARTNTDRHGLKELCKDLLNVDLSKQQQTSDWGTDVLSEEQMRYAASDVLHLHALKSALDGLLAREGRQALAQACFGFLPDRALLDLAGWSEDDIFAH